MNQTDNRSRMLEFFAVASPSESSENVGGTYAGGWFEPNRV